MFKSFRFALMAGLVGALSCAAAQSPALEATPSFADALAAAWAKHPASRGASFARDAASAQQTAATRLMPEPGSLGLGYRADKPVGSGQGARETEAELALPLWRPGQRDAVRGAADATALLVERRLQAQRWQLAGELREAWWDARLARSDAALAEQQLQAASALAADVERRVRAGDLARVDLNQSLSAEHAARMALGQAQALQTNSLRHWTTLTGLHALPAQPELAEGTAGPGADPLPPLPLSLPPPALQSVQPSSHPALAALQARSALAAATASKARAGRYASPELTLTMTRDRGASLDPYGRSARIALRLPLGSNSGADSDVLQALGERAELEAELAQETQRLAAAQAQAQQDRAQRAEQRHLAEERLRLADDTLALQQRAFQLGHIDLATRLRAQAERADAQVQAARAGIEQQRAASRLNQTLGLLP
jgi:outer membrane protein, heavy metal efflux system